MNDTLIAFPFHDWRKAIREGFRTRDGHLLQHFGAHPELTSLVVVNRPTAPVERFLRREPSRVVGELVEAASSSGRQMTVTRPKGGLFVLDVATRDVPGPIPDPRRWWFDVFEDERVIELIRVGIERIGALRGAVIAWLPTVAPIVDVLSPDRFVYDSLDNWLIHPALRKHRDRAESAYELLLPKATEVFVSAPASAAALSPFAPRATILPNGVDPDRFSEPVARPADLPPGTIVGYAGKIARRIDASFVSAVAERLPSHWFVFIGPSLDRKISRQLAAAPNVLVLGDRHYDMLPAYVQHFNVGWIPHAVGEGETGGDPIKLYEYWAAGVPVVSTKIDGLERWNSVLPLVATPAEAENAIKKMIESPIVPEIPRERTWSAIADRVLQPLRIGDPTCV